MTDKDFDYRCNKLAEKLKDTNLINDKILEKEKK